MTIERFPTASRGRRLKEFRRVPWFVLAVYVLGGIFRVLAVVRRQGPRLIYAHWVLPAGFIGALVSAWTGVPLVVHAHGSDVHRHSRRGVGRWVARWTLARARLVLAVSRDMERRIVDRLGVPAARVRRISMGVDGGLFRPEAAAKSSNGPRLEMLYVGDLDPCKGILSLARFVAESSRLEGVTSLHVVGDGVLRDELEALAAAHRDTVVLHGRASQEDVAALMRHRADLLVLPSRGEGAPLAVMEALASGLPVLASPVGGIPDLVRDGETGWLVPPEDFCDRIGALVDRPQDLREARERILALGDDWTVETRASEALDELRKVVNS